MAWMISTPTHSLEPVAFSGVVEGYFDQINIVFRESDRTLRTGGALLPYR